MVVRLIDPLPEDYHPVAPSVPAPTLKAIYPNPLEIASINDFTDWKSVWVQHRWADPSALFRFTVSEFSPMPTRWQGLKFLPGDIVNIKLGGQVAIQNGIITVRETAYDATSH